MNASSGSFTPQQQQLPLDFKPPHTQPPAPGAPQLNQDAPEFKWDPEPPSLPGHTLKNVATYDYNISKNKQPAATPF